MGIWKGQLFISLANHARKRSSSEQFSRTEGEGFMAPRKQMSLLALTPPAKQEPPGHESASLDDMSSAPDARVFSGTLVRI